MKTSYLTLLITLLLVLKGWSQEVTWPRELTNEGSALTLYQPQVQGWEDHKKLEYRMAFSLTPFQGKQVLGVLYMQAETYVNMETHRVLIFDMKVVQTHFPSLDADNTNAMGKVVRSFVTPERSLSISLEQLVASTEKKTPPPTVVVNNDPPVIFFSKRPTILLQLEGAPVKAAASKENLEFVMNANYPLFFDVTNSVYYLHDGLEWQKAQQPAGPWSFTNTIPQSLTNLAKDPNWEHLKNIIPAVTKADKKMSQVFYSEKLAELILFEGEPVYKKINGTALTYATNSFSDIFFCATDKQYYVVTSGRWFRASGLNGPWTFATSTLPADFTKIPTNSPASSILPFVPGTEEANDAAMIAQIPTSVEVNVTEAAKQVHIEYSGEPQFKPIDSTTLYYAVNTADKVIKVSNDQYYACVQGIWFVAPTPTGTWATATSVPEVIYSMPTSSPVYNVTYVTQTVTTVNTVQASYTSGYMGVYVMGSPSGVIIVSGTGYYHPPYYYYPPYGYPVYYHYPMTYGCYAYHPYPYGGVAYHSSYNPNTGAYGRSATAYGPYGSATAGQAYNPSTGTMARGASVSTGYGTRSAAQAYNPYTGASASTRQNSSPYGQWGSSTVTNSRGQTAQAAHATSSSGGAVVAGKGPNSSGAVAKTASGDVYAGKDGNVYKKTDDGWQQHNNGNWTDTEKPQPKNGAANKSGTRQQPSGTGQNFNSQDLNKEYQNRQRGSTQAQQYGNRTGGNGGGRTGGGRRR